MTPIGSCMTSLLTDRFGRKITLIALELLSVLTWFMVALSDKSNLLLFYASGAVAGITRGGRNISAPFPPPKYKIHFFNTRYIFVYSFDISFSSVHQRDYEQ